jgi:hypothetical protein
MRVDYETSFILNNETSFYLSNFPIQALLEHANTQDSMDEQMHRQIER